MEFGFLCLISALILGTCLLVFWSMNRANEWYYMFCLGEKKYPYLPPGDLGWPLAGNMPAFFRAFRSDDPDSFINKLMERYGRTGIYRTHLFGGPSVIVCLPETCRRVLTDDENFELGYPKSTTSLTGKKSFHGISNSEHKRLRKLITGPINGHEALTMYIGHIEKLVRGALEEWASLDRPIQLLSESRKVAFDVITHIFLGPSSNAIAGSAVTKLYAEFNRGLKARPIDIPGFAFHASLKARKQLVMMLERALDERKAANGTNQPKCMADLMMRIQDEHGRKMEDQDIIDLLLVFLLAGHETSAHGIMWATKYLNQYPEALRKARKEQEEILKRRPPNQKGLSMKEIREMHYLHKVVDETLRRTSLSFCNFRKAKVDVKINGYIIPKGWKVLIWQRGVHMDAEIHNEPKEFDPSRWGNFTPKAGAFIPFGAGSRFCPGADLAKLEMFIFMHYFLLGYELEQLDPSCPLVYLPLPRPIDNCIARVKKLPPGPLVELCN